MKIGGSRKYNTTSFLGVSLIQSLQTAPPSSSLFSISSFRSLRPLQVLVPFTLASLAPSLTVGFPLSSLTRFLETQISPRFAPRTQSKFNFFEFNMSHLWRSQYLRISSHTNLSPLCESLQNELNQHIAPLALLHMHVKTINMSHLRRSLIEMTTAKLPTFRCFAAHKKLHHYTIKALVYSSS